MIIGFLQGSSHLLVLVQLPHLLLLEYAGLVENELVNEVHSVCEFQHLRIYLEEVFYLFVVILSLLGTVDSFEIYLMQSEELRLIDVVNLILGSSLV